MATERKNDPILQIEAQKNPRTAVPTLVKLQFDTPFEKEMSNAQGKYTLYTYRVKAVENCHVNLERGQDTWEAEPGTEIMMFAYDGLYRAIEEAEATSGDVIEIVKTGSGKKTNWFVELSSVAGPADAPQAAHQDTRTPPPQGKRWHNPVTPQATATGGASAQERFENRIEQYKAAFVMARSYCEVSELQYSVDLNAMAFTFYKMADDVGCDLTRDSREPEPEVSHEKPVEDDSMRMTLERIFNSSGLPKKDWWEFIRLVHVRETGINKTIKRWDDVEVEIGRAAYSLAKQVHDEIRHEVQQASESEEGEMGPKEVDRLAAYEWRQVFDRLEGVLNETSEEEALPF